MQIMIELKRDDFLNAINRLKSYVMLEMQISFQNDEVIFCINGTKTTSPAKRN